MKKANTHTKKVFIVHGRREKPVRELVAFLGKLGIETIVLRDQPNKGTRVLLEKFKEHALKVGYAFVILTPDDLALCKTDLCLESAHMFSRDLTELRKRINEILKLLEDFDRLIPRGDEVFFEDVQQRCNEGLKKAADFRCDTLKSRARQNVIFELGYFLGALGSQKVCCLYSGEIEFPSDIVGICYIPFHDSVSGVEQTIMKELVAAGLIETQRG